MTKPIEPTNFKNPSPQHLAAELTRQQVDLGALNSLLDLMPPNLATEMAFQTISMKEFIVGLLPLAEPENAKTYTAYEKATKAAAKTGIDYNAEELQQELAKAYVPYITLWNALNHIAENAPLLPEEKTVLKKIPAALKQIIPGLVESRQHFQDEFTSPQMLDASASAEAIRRIKKESGETHDISKGLPEIKHKAEDYEKAAENRKYMEENISEYDSSPEFITKLAGDLAAISKGLGLEGRKKA